MSWRRFGNMLGKLLPPSGDTRLRQALLRLFEQNPRREYTFQHLYLRTHAPSAELLARVLSDLQGEGAVRRVFRVESPTSHAGIGDFEAIDQIPPTMYDRTADREIQVEPEIIRPVFRPSNVGAS